jgi:hypothetical protein
MDSIKPALAGTAGVSPPPLNARSFTLTGSTAPRVNSLLEAGETPAIPGKPFENSHQLARG